MTETLGRAVTDLECSIDQTKGISGAEARATVAALKEVHSALKAGAIKLEAFDDNEHVKKVNVLLGKLDLDGDGQANEKLAVKDGKVVLSHTVDGKTQELKEVSITPENNGIKVGKVEVINLDKEPFIQINGGKFVITELGKIDQSKTTISDGGTVIIRGDKGSAEIREDKTVIGKTTAGEVNLVIPGESYANDGHIFRKTEQGWVERGRDGKVIEELKNVETKPNGDIVVVHKDNSFDVRGNDGSIIKYDANGQPKEVYTKEGSAKKEADGKWYEVDPNTGKTTEPKKEAKVETDEKTGAVTINGKKYERESAPSGENPATKNDDTGKPETKTAEKKWHSQNKGESHEASGETIKGDKREFAVNKDGTMSHTVKSGDTLWSIATEIYKLSHPGEKVNTKEVGEMVRKIKEESKIANEGKIWPGDEITIPKEYADKVKAATGDKKDPAATGDKKEPATAGDKKEPAATAGDKKNSETNMVARLLNDFEILDSNHDGRVTKDEVESARNAYEDPKLRAKYDALLNDFDKIENADSSDNERAGISQSDATKWLNGYNEAQQADRDKRLEQRVDELSKGDGRITLSDLEDKLKATTDTKAAAVIQLMINNYKEIQNMNPDDNTEDGISKSDLKIWLQMRRVIPANNTTKV